MDPHLKSCPFKLRCLYTIVHMSSLVHCLLVDIPWIGHLNCRRMYKLQKFSVDKETAQYHNIHNRLYNLKYFSYISSLFKIKSSDNLSTWLRNIQNDTTVLILDGDLDIDAQRRNNFCYLI